METSPGYRILPHTTDAYIESYGATLEEAFVQAGLALFDTMCNLDSVNCTTTEKIQLKATNELTLLYDWLEKLLLKFELEEKVYAKFDPIKIERCEDGLTLEALLRGESYDRKRHGAKVEVKAVTFHKMEVLYPNDGVVLRFLLDL